MTGPVRSDRRARALLAALVALVLGIAWAARAHAAPSVLDAPNRAFAEGRYGEAAAGFEQIERTRGDSAPLLFDLGNAWLRDGQPVRAILAYERALWLSPRDEAIAANLAVARRVASAPGERSLLARGARALPMNDWIAAAAVGFWVTAGALVAASLRRRRRSWAVAASACAALLTVTASTAAGVEGTTLHRGLVLQSAPVLVSPFASAQSDFALEPGGEVELGATRDAYVFVRATGGRNGWVERAQLEPLIPPSS